MAMPYTGAMPRNPFGVPQPDFGGVQSLAPQSAPLNLPVPKIKKGGMFAGATFDPAAGIAGFLAGLGNPAGITTINAIHEQRMREAEAAAQAAQYEQHRADDNADWMSHYNYEMTNPKPQAPSDFEQTLIESGVKPGTPEWTQAMKTRANNLLDPAVMTPQGLMLRSQVTGMLAPQSPAAPQPGTVEDGYRFKGGNPADPNAWEQVGGAGGNASGNFPQ